MFTWRRREAKSLLVCALKFQNVCAKMANNRLFAWPPVVHARVGGLSLKMYKAH